MLFDFGFDFRLMLFVRLLVVMGVFWILEGVPFRKLIKKFKGPEILILILDICIGLQGIFIFVLFILKPTVLRLIKQRFVFLV